MPDPDPQYISAKNGPSNDVIEKRTWDWFHASVSARFGPAHFREWSPPGREHWPDIIALRGHDRVGFEITSPLKPEDVVMRPANGPTNGTLPDPGSDDESRLTPTQERQKLLEQRVVGALKRKIKKYGAHHSGNPLALLITLAHPSTLRFSSTNTNVAHLASVVRGHFGKFLHQPIDAVYLVGPGEKAYLLWRRRGSRWKKLFPELDDIAQRT